jgi:hypothetical protein
MNAANKAHRSRGERRFGVAEEGSGTRQSDSDFFRLRQIRVVQTEVPLSGRRGIELSEYGERISLTIGDCDYHAWIVNSHGCPADGRFYVIRVEELVILPQIAVWIRGVERGRGANGIGCSKEQDRNQSKCCNETTKHPAPVLFDLDSFLAHSIYNLLKCSIR